MGSAGAIRLLGSKYPPPPSDDSPSAGVIVGWIVGVLAILAIIAALAVREIRRLPPPLASKVDTKHGVKSGLPPTSSETTSVSPAASFTDKYIDTDTLALDMREGSTTSGDAMSTMTRSKGRNSGKDMRALTATEGIYTDISLLDTRAEEPDPLEVSQRERDEWIGMPFLPHSPLSVTHTV